MLRTHPPKKIDEIIRRSVDTDLPEGFSRKLIRTIFQKVLAMGLPSMAGFALMTVYQIVDIYWLAMIGPAPVAAVTIFGGFLWVLTWPNMIVGAGSVAVISRRYGERDALRTEQAIKETFLLKFAIGLLCGIVGIFTLRWVLGIMGAEPDVIELGRTYGVLQLVTLGFCLTSYSIYTAFRGIDRPNTALFIIICGTGLNILLDPLLIFGIGPFPRLGIFGASLATSISYITVVITGMFLLSRKSSPVRVNWKGAPWPSLTEMGRIFRIGAPSGVNHFSFALAQSVVIKFVAEYGTVIVAIFGMSNKVLEIGIMLVVGLGLGTGALIGQYLGSREHHKAWLAGILSIRLGVGLMTAYAAVIIAGAPLIVRMFFNDPQMVEPGVTILRIMALSLPLIGLHIASEEVFTGAGQNTPPAVLSIIHSWVMIVPFMYLFGHVFGWGPNGLMWGWSLAHMIGGLAINYLFRRGTWLTHKV